MPKKKYKYGFKAESNRWSLELRDELGLLRQSPICPWQLSNHLGVPILQLSQQFSHPSREYLLSPKGKAEFSATVCYEGVCAFILNNDAHNMKRQASNIAHELAHVIMGHPPCKPFDEKGKREFLREIEDEAEWLGPALLVSDAAAIHAYSLIHTGQQSLRELSDEWLITEEVINMRMNVSGAKKRFR